MEEKARSVPAEAGRLQVIEVTSRGDIRRFTDLLKKEHYLGPRALAGESIRQAVVRDGKWVAVLLWCAAARRLKPREAYIGWNAAQRSTRLKLVAQNARFLVPTAAREPNLASACLAAACRELPQQWRTRYGFAPVLAETFTDPERFRGTCYRANGWFEAGATGGFARVTADYYLDKKHPKILWLKALRPDAREILRARVLPPEFAAASCAVPERCLPLPQPLVESLFDACCGVPDPRRSNKSFAIGPVLSIVILAILCGASDLMAILRFGQQLRQDQRRLLCLPWNKRNRDLRRVPSYKVYYNLLRKLDNAALARCLNTWYQAHMRTLPPALAMDGKFVGAICGTLNLAAHGDGRTVVSLPVPGKGHEGRVGREALASLPDGLQGRVVTGDALHTQERTARAIVENGGEYLLQIKANQPTLRTQALARVESTPFLPTPRADMAG